VSGRSDGCAFFILLQSPRAVAATCVLTVTIRGAIARSDTRAKIEQPASDIRITILLSVRLSSRDEALGEHKLGR